MSGNLSTAVRQRRVEPHDSLDDFPTPPWAVRALCERLQNPCDALLRFGDPIAAERAPTTAALTCREPAANRGHMVRALRESFAHVEAADVHDYGVGFPVVDYLFGPDPAPVDWTITNPPFRLAEAFIARAQRTSRQGVAMLVRSAFLEGIRRHERLFAVAPPTLVLQFAERVVMHRGRLAPEGSTATAYCWLVWEPVAPRAVATRLDWIAPCRARLERPGDYACS